jgi:hypothetical protein
MALTKPCSRIEPSSGTPRLSIPRIAARIPEFSWDLRKKPTPLPPRTGARAVRPIASSQEPFESRDSLTDFVRAWRGGADNQINRCATGTPRPSGQNSAVTGPHRKRLRGVSDKPLIFLIDLAFCLENCVFFARLLRIVV